MSARRMQACPIAATCDQPQCRHRGYHDEFQSCDRESRPYCPGPCRPVEHSLDIGDMVKKDGHDDCPLEVTGYILIAGPCRPVEREQDDIERLLDGLEDAAFARGYAAADDKLADPHMGTLSAKVAAARAAIVAAWDRRDLEVERLEEKVEELRRGLLAKEGSK